MNEEIRKAPTSTNRSGINPTVWQRSKSSAPVIKKLPPGPERSELHFDRPGEDIEPNASRFGQGESEDGDPYQETPEELLLNKRFGEPVEGEGAWTDSVRFAKGETGAKRIPRDWNDTSREFRYLKRRFLSEGLPASARLQAALDAGEEWAIHATPANIFRLRKRCALALIHRYWGGQTYEAISLDIGWGTPDAARIAIKRAKRSLCTMPVSAPMPKV